MIGNAADLDRNCRRRVALSVFEAVSDATKESLEQKSGLDSHRRPCHNKSRKPCIQCTSTDS